MLSNNAENLFLQKLLAKIARRCPGYVLPSTYMVWDTETGGTNVADDMIVQFGFCCVADNEVKDKISYYVKCPPGYQMSPGAVAIHGITPEKLEKEGVSHAEGYEIAHQLFENWRRAGHMFMGHNCLAFDTPIFELGARRLGMEWKFRENEQLDTGMLVKASRLPHDIKDDESLRSFYVKVSEVKRRGLYWSLDRFCIENYKLHQHGVTATGAHDAGNDCFATHCLYKEFNSGIAY
jgi:exonuclease I